MIYHSTSKNGNIEKLEKLVAKLREKKDILYT